MTTRRCYRCKKIKDISLFANDKSRSLGKSYICSICQKIRSRLRGRSSYVKRSEYFKKYRQEHQDKLRQQYDYWKSRNKEKISAHSKARYAYVHGKIIKTPCAVCGDINSEMHHPDYSKPLKVVWLCRKHHGQTRKKQQPY